MDGPGLKACGPCGKAKRKCDKQFPTCSRCQAKAIECVYPASSGRFIVYAADDEPWQRISRTDMSLPDQPFSNIHTTPLLDSDMGLLPSPDASPSSTLPDLHNAWFLTPQSLNLVPLDMDIFEAPTKESVLKFMNRLRGWLADWATQGGNAFIHPRLYRTRQPLCIRDAFTMVSSYLARTSKTDTLLQHILEARIVALDESAESELLPAGDCYGHLSRVHALLAYMIIGLFDGDIRQRYVAEKRLPTLRCWMDAMLSSISCAVENGRLFQLGYIDGTSGQNLRHDLKEEEILWHAWILSESIRRTWIIAHLTYSIYNAMQINAPECENIALKYTTRRGAWDASSAFSWTKICLENNIGLLQRDEVVPLFSECTPNDVDIYCKVIMELDYGQEKLREWGVDLDDDVNKY